ncbi:MAG: diguanylate cyclase [Clostridia bacterium]|nr:diguanylate cyclase [Clostridia bacterium]
MVDKSKRLTFGFVVNYIASWEDADYYQSLILSGIADFAKEYDINLMCFVAGMFNSPHKWERGRNILYNFIDKNKIDGLIVLSSAVEAYASPLQLLKKLHKNKGLPVVTIGNRFDGYPSVSADNFLGMRQSVDHLVEVHGSRQIVFIKGTEGSKDSDLRLNAYLESLKSHNIPINPKLIFPGKFNFASGEEVVKLLLKKKISFDAIVAANDNMAIGALDELGRQLGAAHKKIPVIGFDNIEASRLRSLTTVHQPCYELGRSASDMLLRLVHNQLIEMEELLPTKVLFRSSCGCIPSMVRNAYSVELQKAGSSMQSSIDELIASLLYKFDKVTRSADLALNSRDFDELFEYEKRLIDAFLEEYLSGKKDQFIQAYDQVISLCELKRIKLSFLHNILSCLRQDILEYLPSDSNIILAENMFQAARIQISDAVERFGSSNITLTANRIDALNWLEEELVANMDWHAQIETLDRNIFQYGINRCYISLYENPEKPLEKSKLIYASNQGNRFYTGSNGTSHATQELLPEGILHDLYQERFSIIIEALHLGSDQLGYAILGFDTRINRAFEIIRHRLSIALKEALLIEKVTNQAVNLEKQVIERTRELAIANEQLKQEVCKRKDAEDELMKLLNDLKSSNSQLHLQSMKDELTGLYNRRGFMELGLAQYEHFKKIHQEFLVFYIDLDGLKQINDQYGHAEGDYAIVKASEILHKSFRGSDIIARIGGDEFTVLALQASPPNEDKIRSRIDQFCQVHNQSSNKPYQLSLSIGSSSFNPELPVEFEDLVKTADAALYEEKLRKKGLKCPGIN